MARLGAEREIALLCDRLDRWLETADPELREAVSWALAGRRKPFRPLTVFACRRAIGDRVGEGTIEAAFAIELLHNMTLVIDDVLDGSPDCRGVATLQVGRRLSRPRAKYPATGSSIGSTHPTRRRSK